MSTREGEFLWHRRLLQMDGRQSPEYWVREKQIGALLHVTGEITQTMQQLAAQNRLGIPLLFGIDAVHGHAIHPTGIAFPTQLGLSCSWNPQLLEEIGKVTAKEVAATGIHWTFAPVLDIARDLRWGRIDETFGEDPLLVGVLGSAVLRGYQTAVKELKAFQRVELQAGETRTVELEVPYQQLALVNESLETVVEPGEFEVMVGSSSRDRDLLKEHLKV